VQSQKNKKQSILEDTDFWFTNRNKRSHSFNLQIIIPSPRKLKWAIYEKLWEQILRSSPDKRFEKPIRKCSKTAILMIAFWKEKMKGSRFHDTWEKTYYKPFITSRPKNQL